MVKSSYEWLWGVGYEWLRVVLRGFGLVAVVMLGYEWLWGGYDWLRVVMSIYE